MWAIQTLGRKQAVFPVRVLAKWYGESLTILFDNETKEKSERRITVGKRYILLDLKRQECNSDRHGDETHGSCWCGVREQCGGLSGLNGCEAGF